MLPPRVKPGGLTVEQIYTGLLTIVADRALALAQDADDRAQRRGLAGAVAAEQR
jgi:hypothetical protein